MRGPGRLLNLPHKMDLWPQLAITISLGFLIFFAAFSLLSIRMVNDSTDRILKERLVLTQMAANEIDALLERGYFELAKGAAFARFDPQAANLVEERHVLSHAYGRLSAFSLGIYFYDAEGKIVATEPTSAGIAGNDHSSRSHVRQVIASNQRSISIPFLDTGTGAPAVALAIPILDAQGRLMSILAGVIDLSSPDIRRPIEQAMRLGATGHAEIVDSQGRVIVSTFDRDFQRPGDHPTFYKRMMADRLTGVEEVLDEHDMSHPHNHVMSFVPLSLANWGVAVGGDARDTFAPAATLRNSIFLLGGLAFVAILTATLIGARRLVRPIRMLTGSAQAIAGGNLDDPIQGPVGGEIGTLGRSLDDMRVKLKEYIDEIHRWNSELEARVSERTGELELLLEEVSSLHAMHELDRVKSEFISSISHELRTPLGFITGYVTTLLRPDVPHSEQATREFLQIIKEESENLQELVENLLDTSRIQAGSFTVEKEPTDIVELAHKSVEKQRSLSDRHSFLLHFETSFPSVPGDSRRLEQVFHNLLDNAMKYSPQDGQITINGELKSDRIQVSVADEGRGIPPAELATIFNAFYRVPDPDDRKVRGAGLGLTICRAIVEAHGGTIWAESVPGKGSIFYFALPLGGDS